MGKGEFGSEYSGRSYKAVREGGEGKEPGWGFAEHGATLRSRDGAGGDLLVVWGALWCPGLFSEGLEGCAVWPVCGLEGQARGMGLFRVLWSF